MKLYSPEQCMDFWQRQKFRRKTEITMWASIEKCLEYAIQQDLIARELSNIKTDIAEHDKQIRGEVLEEVEQAMYHQCFEVDNPQDMQKWDSGNWFRYKLFENVIEKLKGGKE